MILQRYKMETSIKFKILTEGAKYDVSCASSGTKRGMTKGMHGLTNSSGICHSFTADGRCISLIKVLLTNNCIYDCQYCVNRKSADVERAMFEPGELCNLIMGFYKRNYIEGLFLSSAVFRSPDYTMELMIKTIELLRTKYYFNGYIHMKAIPGCDPLLLDKASKLADRISVNMELPSKTSLKMLCPDKPAENIVSPMKHLAKIYTAQKNGEYGNKSVLSAGQSTQMVIGATNDTDGNIIRLAEKMYRKLQMRRVYYSAYVPMGSQLLPDKPPNLVRENRLYQADWLIRFYGFRAEELIPLHMNLPLEMDPKCAWAIRNLDKFPIEVNTADPLMLLRVPGIGQKSVAKIISSRRLGKLTYEDLKKMRVVLKRASNFILCDGKYYGRGFHEDVLKNMLVTPEFIKMEPHQLALFPENNTKKLNSQPVTTLLLPQELIHSSITGEL